MYCYSHTTPLRIGMTSFYTQYRTTYLPQKPQSVAILLRNPDLQIHLFNICSDCVSILSEMQQYMNKFVVQVWTLKTLIVQTHVTCFAAQSKTTRSLPGFDALTTAWCGRYHTESSRRGMSSTGTFSEYPSNSSFMI